MLGFLPFNHLLQPPPPNHMHTYTHMLFDLYDQCSNEPCRTTSSSSTHRAHRQKHSRAHSMYWKCTPTDTQVPLFSYHRRSNPSRLLSRSLRLGSIQSGFHSALPIPDEQPFTIQLTVINYHHRHYYHDSSTSKASSKPSHQGELSHGIKILFWCFHVQKQQTTKITVLTLALIFGVICCLKHVTPYSCKEIMYSWR